MHEYFIGELTVSFSNHTVSQTNLYPTPLTEKKYLGSFGSASKYFLKASIKLSTVRVEG